MPNYAIYETDIITNVIVAENKEAAEDATGLSAVISIEGEPWLEWVLLNGEWVPPAPHPSWIFIDQEWVAPISMPDDGKEYYWNEQLLQWVERVENDGN